MTNDKTKTNGGNELFLCAFTSSVPLNQLTIMQTLSQANSYAAHGTCLTKSAQGFKI